MQEARAWIRGAEMHTRLTLCAVAVVSLPTRAHAQCQYDLSTFQGPTCEFTQSPTRGRGINEAEQVAGDYTLCGIGTGEAFLWDGSLLTLQRPPGVTGAGAWDINDAGLIAGQMIVSGLGDRAFLHDGVDFINLGTLPGGTLSRGRAINSLGQIVGVWGGPGDLPALAAFLWQDGAMIDINADLGTPHSEALDINDVGQVVGWMGNATADAHAFVWEAGNVIDLGVIPGGFTAVASANNSLGQVVGSGRVQTDTSVVTRAFLWDGATMFNLGTVPGFERGAAADINDVGQIVGRAWGIAGNPNIETAFIWQNGIMYDLNDLVVPSTGAEIVWAIAINNQGQITGEGYDIDGDIVAVLLTPVDVPFGDLDGDCTVGIDDFLILLAAWGPCPPAGGCPADLNGDGSVGVVDFLVLLANWG
jgi:probable HAF family extracellular repeat protein